MIGADGAQPRAARGAGDRKDGASEELGRSFEGRVLRVPLREYLEAGAGTQVSGYRVYQDLAEFNAWFLQPVRLTYLRHET